MKKLLTAVLFAAAVATPLAASAASMPKVEKARHSLQKQKVFGLMSALPKNLKKATYKVHSIFRMTKSLTASNPSARIKTHRSTSTAAAAAVQKSR
ncbi:hypothetical protein NEISUBOT_04726 [Neisseria subflava NJ9703]|uniref:Uncharacterized protein n=1 Tax=Neisseria subflava NJ9703 TaxID=546268 RepID=A0A9W5IQ79_NEISU|nr:hypothetical protein NEISUBOT_04726 [Neisseria subflava NJ9703]